MIKKLLFAIFAMTYTFTAISQQQPQNPSFEDWEDVSLDVPEPENWSSIKTADALGGFAPYVWDQSTDAHTGTYSVKVYNEDTFVGIVAAGTMTNGRIHAEISGTGWAFTNPADSRWNTPLTQKPDSIAVWAKFTKVGSDVAQVKAVIHEDGEAKIADEDSTYYIGVSTISIPESVATWTRFSAPFTYLNELDPVYVLMVLSSADNSATLGSEAYYDDVEFIYNPLLLDLKVFLEGPYSSNGEMETGLNPDYLPLTQPFNTTPWNYNGTESVAAIPNTDVVDWILVELRDAPDAASATSATTLARQAGFLLSDGSIVGLDGMSKIRFDNLFNYDINENLFVVIQHRNHLGIMSANPLTKVDGEYAYDFSADAANNYGGVAAVKQLEIFGPNVWGMMGGDGDANGTVNNIDKTSFWSILSGKSGYFSGDYNLDGQINNIDKNDVWFDNIDKNTQVPN